jgi:crossover junction endodeoxyribonuclease RusA
MMVSIETPWPNPVLSPNKRPHWAVKHKAAKKDRQQAAWITNKIAKETYALPFPAENDIPVTITFYPPDNRRRDRDNMIASLKATMDGVADGLGVDDKRFVTTYKVGEAITGGKVVIEVTALPDYQKGTSSEKPSHE